MAHVLNTPITTYLPHGQTYSNRGAEALYWAGRALTKPLDHAIQQITKTFFLSLEKDVDGRMDSLPLEYGRRALWMLQAAVIILTVLPVLLGIMGFGLMAATNTSREDFTFIHSDKMPEPIDPDQFTQTTFNLGSLPSWISPINNIRSTEERIQQFIDYARDHQNADCICLQELFEENSIKMVIEGLRDKYPNIVAGAGRQTAGMNSGLCILSKYPISEPAFWGFNNLHGDDDYARKGVLGVKINVSEDEQITVFTTHLQSGGSDRASQTRFTQLRALEHLYSSPYCASSEKTCAGILTCADLNIGKYASGQDAKGNPEVDSDWEPSRWFFENTNHKYELDLSDRQKGTTWKKGSPFTGWSANTDDWTRKFNEIDHILAAKCANIPTLVGALRIDPAFGICSDHIPVTGTFQIR